MKKYWRVYLCALLISLLCCMPTALSYSDDGRLIAIESADSSVVSTGDMVVRVQTRLRELDYFYFKPTGRFQSMTRSAVIEFQKYQEDEEKKPFIADGTVGEQSKARLFSPGAVRAPIAAQIHIPIGAGADGSQTKTGVQLVWPQVKALLQAGEAYTLTDFNTGVTFSMVYTGGEHHAEVECASANDTQLYKDNFGGAFNYSKRPMLIQIEGQTIACSLQGQPHGEDTLARNDMDGHACLFFSESVSHVGKVSDVEHINNIYVAAGRSQ